MATLYGFIEKITYYSEENHFVVAKLQERGKRELTTIVGNLVGINPGESVKLTGNWVHNKKYGEQFRIENYEIMVPSTVLGIKKYLGSGMIRGIGSVMAERIVDAFGLDTLEVIEKRSEKLSEVEGIGPKRIAMITQAWEEQKEVKEIMIFLQGHGVSLAYAAKIYRRYGNHSIEKVRENPYRLAQEIHGIGFITADRIAQNMGVDPHSLLRAKAGVLHVLNGLTEEGHVYYPETELTERAKTILKVEPEVIAQALGELSGKQEIFREAVSNGQAHTAVYLAPLYVAETGIAQRLKALRETPSPIRPIHPQKAIEWVQQRLNIELAEKQKEAVTRAATSKLLILTGGPGTGKTTIITAILRIFQQLKLRVLLAAPTGRAAKRMSETTGWEAKTIHRLLEYSPQKGGFQKDQEDPLEADSVIIDESSMVDTLLMYHLLKAIPVHAHLILVGDADQLPSVGPGNVLKEIIGSGIGTVIRLTEIFRQAQESMIVVNAHRLNQGDYPILNDFEENEKADFYFIQEEAPEKILEKMVSLCTEKIPRRFGFHPTRDIQVLSPMHKGTLGTINLNNELQRMLNPGRQAILHGSRTFHLGDKVMQITNNYDKDVFNGDIGSISKIDLENREVTLDFDGRLISYDYPDLDEIVLAYAISIHKSQGSEYPAVIFPVTTQHYLLLQRNLMYTALTRAKKLAVCIGTKKALAMAINNNKPQWRFTHLSGRLAA